MASSIQFPSVGAWTHDAGMQHVVMPQCPGLAETRLIARKYAACRTCQTVGHNTLAKDRRQGLPSLRRRLTQRGGQGLVRWVRHSKVGSKFLSCRSLSCRSLSLFLEISQQGRHPQCRWVGAVGAEWPELHGVSIHSKPGQMPKTEVDRGPDRSQQLAP